MSVKEKNKQFIFTVGHSTRTIESFIDILRSFKIEQVIDIRTIAKSSHNPQFNQSDLRRALKNKRIGYRHMKGLGGLRHAKKDSINIGWHNTSFRGYADYMQTPEFAQNLERLMEYAHAKRVVIMCAEAVPWRCHRSLVGDALLVRGWDVQDIMSVGKSNAHKMTPWAHVKGFKIWYPNK